MLQAVLELGAAHPVFDGQVLHRLEEEVTPVTPASGAEAGG